MLLKLLYKLHNDTQSSWAKWVRQNVCLATLEGEIAGSHWEMLRSLLPLYQAITTVNVGDGRSTSFWNDVWIGDECLSDRFPLLRSHCKQANQSVSDVVRHGLRHHLVPRLTPEAQSKLSLLGVLLSQVNLEDKPDSRCSLFADVEGNLRTSELYALIKSMGTADGGVVSCFWKSCAPPRVQFFAWLLVNGRIQCKDNLLRRKIVQDNTCDLCSREPETALHLLFLCPFAASFWRALGIELPPGLDIHDVHKIPRPNTIPAAHFDAFILLCCWHLWKRRNDITFRQETMSLRQTLQACRSDAKLWSCRLPRAERHLGDLWCSLFSLAI